MEYFDKNRVFQEKLSCRSAAPSMETGEPPQKMKRKNWKIVMYWLRISYCVFKIYEKFHIEIQVSNFCRVWKSVLSKVGSPRCLRVQWYNFGISICLYISSFIKKHSSINVYGWHFCWQTFGFSNPRNFYLWTVVDLVIHFNIFLTNCCLDFQIQLSSNIRCIYETIS